MTIYNLYLFDRDGQLLHYAEWTRRKQSGISREEEAKLMYGMIFSLKSFVAKVSPSKEVILNLNEICDLMDEFDKEIITFAITPPEEADTMLWSAWIQAVYKRYHLLTYEGFLTYCTNKYRLNLYETPSRLKFVLNTDVNAQGVKDLLHQIYTQVYVEHVVYNPLCQLSKPILSELFATKLDEVVKQSPAYASRPA